MGNTRFFFTLLFVVIMTKTSQCQIAGNCAAIESSFGYSPTGITNTPLQTISFYQLTLTNPEWESGYVSWSSMDDPTGAAYTFVNYDDPDGSYSPGNSLCNDTLWAFVDTDKLGWYYLINCRYPNKYLTVTDFQAGNEPRRWLVLDDLNNRAPEMYMWSPRMQKDNKYTIIPFFVDKWRMARSSTLYVDDASDSRKYSLQVERNSNTPKSQKDKYLFSANAAVYN